ncbi:hypothetical protein L1049_005252 [Liquidambar formosana]|uniref:Uncharacterized protein n=1 Tax=Liquidambar formosana TaxID=63359 RepID=A0AAP0X1B5_LIQFO
MGSDNVRMLRIQGISRMDAPPLEKEPTEVSIEEVSDVSDGPQQTKAKNIAQKSPREKIPPKTKNNNRTAVKKVSNAPQKAQKDESPDKSKKESKSAGKLDFNEPTQDLLELIPTERTPIPDPGSFPIFSPNLEQSGFNRPFESSSDIKIACLSESAPLIIEDTDSIFADLDQIISDATSQAASTSAMKPQGEADKAPPSQEEMDEAKAILEKSLSLNFEHLLHPSRRGKFLEAISILTSFSDFSSDKVSAFERFQSNFPSLASNFQSSEKKLEEYQKWIYSKDSLLETLKNHVADYKTLKTKQESNNEEVKKLQQELKLREEENKKIISKKQELAKETQVMKSTLAKYNTEASSWEENKKKVEDTCSHVFCSWENFKKNFV